MLAVINVKQGAERLALGLTAFKICFSRVRVRAHARARSTNSGYKIDRIVLQFFLRYIYIVYIEKKRLWTNCPLRFFFYGQIVLDYGLFVLVSRARVGDRRVHARMCV